MSFEHSPARAGSASPLADDLLRGVPAIAAYLGESNRRTYYLCDNGYIPAFKIGSIWHARRSALDRHYGGAAVAGE